VSGSLDSNAYLESVTPPEELEAMLGGDLNDFLWARSDRFISEGELY
jgi:hypothetical protein